MAERERDVTDAAAPRRRWSIRNGLDAIATLGMIAASAAIIWTTMGRGPAEAGLPLPSEPVSLEGVATKGSTSAKVVLIEYSDFQCPFCAQLAANTLPEIRAKYVDTGKVLMAFRHVPLNIHPFARPAGAAAECAGKQGKFWEMHDLLFQRQAELDPDGLLARARDLSLDLESFGACLGGEGLAIVRKHEGHALVLGVTSTPQLLIGTLEQDGRVRIRARLSGAQPASAVEKALNELLD